MAKKKDFSVAKIKFLLEEKGLSIVEVERRNGLRPRECQNATDKAYFKGEQAIAKELGMHPKKIWPSRYDSKGERLKPQPYENYISKRRFKQGLKAA
ncbi:MAG: helix-turn-helix domain-containing protein [Rhizobiales bacterium]|nr:helix-turn-helix domain-containing protein [Hyphomicrobiales bacterium]